MSTLDRWDRNFEVADICPWAGPVPLQKHQSHLLVGRVDDSERFEDLLKEENRRLILLHAPSGAGKSSFLQAGLAYDLELRGRDVRSVSQWGGYEGEGARAFLAKRLGLEGDDPFARFGEQGASGVLILDQFEELIRYSPAITRQLFEEILRINRLYDTKIIVSFRSEYLHTFADLERGATNFSVAPMAVREIEGDGHALAVVKSGNWDRDEGDSDVVDREAAAWLAQQWIEAQSHQSSGDGLVSDDPFDRIGLLHLQSLLYSLFFASDGQTLTLKRLGSILVDWAGRHDRDLDAAAHLARGLSAADFRAALGRSVELKLDHCDEAGRKDDLVDRELRRGTRWMVERTVGHLSSGGYKLVRSASELAVLALGPDHVQLRRALNDDSVTDVDEARLLGAMLKMAQVGSSPGPGLRGVDGTAASLDLIDVSRRDLADLLDRKLDAAPDASTQPDDVGPGVRWRPLLATPGSEAFENDPEGITAGYLFGCRPADALIEELRRFAFALRWLQRCDLVRIATPLSGDPMVSVVHDGFGSALSAWSKEAARDPEGPLSAITAPRGLTYEWSDRVAGLLRSRVGDDDPERGTPTPEGIWAETHRVLTNLRWKNCVIEKTRLERIAFLNCDFQGLTFKQCDLRGVVFVNCLLDGAQFGDCSFSGDMTNLPEDADWSPADPNFVIEVDQDVAPLFRRSLWDQQDVVAGESRAVFCDLPGAAAIPWDTVEIEPDGTPRTYPVQRDDVEHQGRLKVDLVDGGAAVYGGRVSNLLVRHCRFLGNSHLAIRHATGSGLDLVEVRAESEEEGPSQVEIFGSAVRHLTVSSSKNEVGSIKLSVVQGMLPQTYVGTGLRGLVTVVASSLFHTWNGSPHSEGSPGVEFRARYSIVHGAIDIAMDDDCLPVGDGPQAERAADLDLPAGFKKEGQTLSERLGRMDFRGNPAKFRADERRARS